MPQPLRWTVQRTIFHLLDEPVPALADPFPSDDPLPGAYELHLPADDVTISVRQSNRRHATHSRSEVAMARNVLTSALF